MFINHELKAIYLHNPKCGGAYIRNILTEYYGFTEVSRNIHMNFSDFVDNPINMNEDIDKHTIRKLGKYRYFYSHQDVKKEWFNTYFIFTFVRDPYRRILSAYSYLKKNMYIENNFIEFTPDGRINFLYKQQINNKLDKYKISNSYENINYFKNFNEFIKNYKFVNNISFFHSFITQYDQLIDFSNNMNIHYIGKTEILENELVYILNKLGILEIKHLDVFKNKKINKSKNTKIEFEYNKETFLFITEYFKNDFEYFNYKKFDNYEEFKLYYCNNIVNHI
jgi:hypothetical protein